MQGLVQEKWPPKEATSLYDAFLSSTPPKFQIAATGKRNGVTG